MNLEEILFKVGQDGKLRSYLVTLGRGSYVNLMDRETGEYMNMENRAMYRATERAAWAHHLSLLLGSIEFAKVNAIKSQQNLAVFHRIRVAYKEKANDIAEAERVAQSWIEELRKLKQRLPYVRRKTHE